jgi:hypothetical protein
MRCDENRSAAMNIRRAVLILVAAIMTASCSEKPAPDPEKDVNTPKAPREVARAPGSEKAERESELQPDEDQIAEDCAAFVRATKVVPARAASTDCPGCPAGGTDVFSFRHMKTNAVSCSGDTCTVVVTIRAVFNPGSGETINGGLTAWIPAQQRTAYLSGQTPSGEQAYRVQVIYKRRAEGWRAVEFDRAPDE